MTTQGQSVGTFRSVKIAADSIPGTIQVDSHDKIKPNSLPRVVKTGNALPVLLFLVALIIPWTLPVGPLRLSVYRFVLLAMILPCLISLFAGKAGRVRFPDILLIVFALWPGAGLIAIHGVAIAIESAGIIFIETVGAYLLARCYIRDADDFHAAVQLLFRITLLLIPFAVVEFASGRNILREAFGLIFQVSHYEPQYRSGFVRVASVFDHPILFGVYLGAVSGLTHIVLGYQKGLVRRSLRSGLVLAATYTSLSAGPVGAAAMQVLLLSWGEVMRGLRNRWKLLICILFSLFILIEIAAKRSALNIIVSFFVFDSSSYWYRRIIWDVGSAEALRHPLFGVGLNDWARPAWMPTASIDNFWLYEAIKHGLPAPILLLAAFSWIVLSVGLMRNLNERVVEFRTGFLIAMTFFFLVGWTVHFWDTAYVLFFFLLGSGVWILDAGRPHGTWDEQGRSTPDAEQPRRWGATGGNGTGRHQRASGSRNLIRTAEGGDRQGILA